MTNVEKVHFYFKDFESPTHFISWDYLYMVASCLGRRVWLQDPAVAIYPNIYVIIVGPPAVGKSLPANILTKILAGLVEMKDNNTPVPLVNITPTCVTLEALYDFIAQSTRAFKVKEGSYYYHASVSFALGDEIGLLFKSKETTNDLVSFLIAGFDCGEFTYKTKKSGDAKIKNMCVNFLGCCTPTWITRSLTSDIIGEGFTSRCIFLWGDKKRQITTRLRISPEQCTAMEEVKKHFRNLAHIQGQLTETDEAFKFLDEWYHKSQAAEYKRVNADKKLDYYYDRKKVLMQKLAILCHFSEPNYNMTITLQDYKNAAALLTAAEMDMHKALAVATRNPLATVAEHIKKILAVKKIATSSQILAEAFDGGNRQEIEDAKSFLLETQQIELTPHGFKLKESAITASELTETSSGLINPERVFPDEAPVPTSHLGSS